MSNDQTTQTDAVGAVSRAQAGKYLTFQLAEETYGIEILRVQEIIQMVSVTSVPRTPPFVRGVINLRGKVIPVVDLRIKFEMAACEDTQTTCIIVVQLSSGSTKVTTGVIVDAVAEVLDISKDEIEPAPSFGTTVDTDFILGVGNVRDKVVMLLDIDRVMSNEEVGALVQVDG